MLVELGLPSFNTAFSNAGFIFNNRPQPSTGRYLTVCDCVFVTVYDLLWTQVILFLSVSVSVFLVRLSVIFYEPRQIASDKVSKCLFTSRIVQFFNSLVTKEIKKLHNRTVK